MIITQKQFVFPFFCNYGTENHLYKNNKKKSEQMSLLGKCQKFAFFLDFLYQLSFLCNYSSIDL